jgi:hypothetical protein
MFAEALFVFFCLLNLWIDGWMDGWMDGWTDGLIVELKDGLFITEFKD